MDANGPSRPADETNAIRVHYWASARVAAGRDAESVVVSEPISLAELINVLVDRHPDSNLVDVLQACSVLRGDEPVKNRDPASVEVRPGQSIEFLPPFAGG
jgi:molybdopterin synthase sulfur carrier subunit